jgi:ABC-2 type transport system ATP-binding protein
MERITIRFHPYPFSTIKTMDVIKIEGLQKSRREFQLGPFDLRVEPGAILGVLGRDKSGRTTLLRLLWGFERPDRGTVEVFGMKPHLEPIPVRRRAGYAAEDVWWYPLLTTMQFIEFIGGFYPNWDMDYARTLMREFAVSEWYLLRELPMAELRKLNMIAALGHHPSLVILDEPTSDLDDKTAVKVLDFLRKLSREKRVTIVMSGPHNLDLDDFADGLLMVNNGEVVEQTI